MKKMIKLALAATLGLGLSGLAQAAIIADGNLSDWGLSNQWTPSGNANGNGTYTHGAYKIYYSVEDYITGNNGQVIPGYGGQAYDAEALYVTWDINTLYIALVTGHDPNTSQNPGANSYGAGDFALNFWSGSSNDGSYEFGIQNTKTIGGSSANVYKTTNTDWNTDPIWNTGAVTSLKNPITGTLQGTASLWIQAQPNSTMGSNANRWIYELSVNRSLFQGLDDPNSKLNVSWTMNCANDIIGSDPTTPVPEPATLALLGLSMPAVAWRRRQQARRQK